MKKIFAIALLAISSVTLLSWTGDALTETATKFLNGLYRVDIPAAKSVATAESQKQLDSYGEMMSFVQGSARDEMKKTQVKILSTLVTGTTAVVQYKISYPEDGGIKTLKMVQVNGDWKAQWSKNDIMGRDSTAATPAIDTTMTTSTEITPPPVSPSQKSGSSKSATNRR